jgi:glycosyltransferase involved in cell wall biosynthesis
MAMARPVVAALSCVAPIDAIAGDELVSADSATDYVREISALLQAPERSAAVGQAGRVRVIKAYSWEAHLSRIDRHLTAKASA